MGNTGPTIGAFWKCVGNYPYYAFDIVSDVNVRETQGREPMFLQAPIASPVVFRIMRIAVDFDDQPFSRAEEVANVWKNHGLPAKFMAELRVRQVAPDTDFPFRWVTTHFTRSFEEFSLGYHCPTPTQLQVNDAPRRLDHAGGMIDLQLLKGRGLFGHHPNFSITASETS